MVEVNTNIVYKTDKYWDCECDGDKFIHPVSQSFCPVCGALEKDQPDSRVEELLKYGVEDGHTTPVRLARLYLSLNLSVETWPRIRTSIDMDEATTLWVYRDAENNPRAEIVFDVERCPQQLKLQLI